MPWPSPCSSTAGCPGLLSGHVVTVSEDGDSTISLSNLFQGLITLKEVLFPMFKWNFSYLNTCLSLLVLSLVRSPEPPLLQTLSAPGMSDLLCSPVLGSSVSSPMLYWEPSSSSECSTPDVLSSAEQRGRRPRPTSHALSNPRPSLRSPFHQ